jgi:hypothetical protein
MSAPLVPCPDCHALFPESDGPTHPYLGGSPGCWAAFNDLGLRELDLGIAGPDRLSVHAYTVQHPGAEGRREAQSVDVHLMVLCAVLEHGVSTPRAVGAMQGWLAGNATHAWLTPPADPGARTIQSIPANADRATHVIAVRGWAEAVWHAWAAHHGTVRAWLAAGGAR